MRLHFDALAYCFIYFLQTAASTHGRFAARDAPFDQVREIPDRSHQAADEAEPEKYFHESTFSKHYDGRFADKQLNYNERRSSLTALMQTYVSTMNDIGAETWIMHGSLLGWYWSRKTLPCDLDIDVMVSEQSIHHLANYYNMTVHTFSLTSNTEDGENRSSSYMLEINPHYTNSTLDSVNKIDARWIDTSTGVFIDITTLRRNSTAQALGFPDAMMVKDTHHYNYDDIFPLRHSIFEGYPVQIPYAYAELLMEEYGAKALSEVYFQNHRFDPGRGEWVALSCKDFGTCGNYRNPVDGVNLPVSSGKRDQDEAAALSQLGAAEHAEPSSGAQMGDSLPLSRLIDQRPRSSRRWQA
ncbi:mannosyltransferase [Friedmanniomyces endolithicus]|nr:mannosyltransferase [Friedmanniomyces endolithicus]